jgi:hypothetical protein
VHEVGTEIDALVRSGSRSLGDAQVWVDMTIFTWPYSHVRADIVLVVTSYRGPNSPPPATVTRIPTSKECASTYTATTKPTCTYETKPTKSQTRPHQLRSSHHFVFVAVSFGVSEDFSGVGVTLAVLEISYLLVLVSFSLLDVFVSFSLLDVLVSFSLLDVLVSLSLEDVS